MVKQFLGGAGKVPGDPAGAQGVFFDSCEGGAGGKSPPANMGGLERPAGMARVEVARIDTAGMVLEVKNEELQPEEDPEELFKRLDECFR